MEQIKIKITSLRLHPDVVEFLEIIGLGSPQTIFQDRIKFSEELLSTIHELRPIHALERKRHHYVYGGVLPFLRLQHSDPHAMIKIHLHTNVSRSKIRSTIYSDLILAGITLPAGLGNAFLIQLWAAVLPEDRVRWLGIKSKAELYKAVGISRSTLKRRLRLHKSGESHVA